MSRPDLGRHSSLRVLPALVILAFLFGACRAGVEDAASSPVVLITLAGVRADVVGAASREPSWTPRWNEFTASADRSATAVAASSDPVASLASLLYGAKVWQHQLLSGGLRSRSPQRRLKTLAELLKEAGYRTRAHAPGWLVEHGLEAGFDRHLEPPSDRRAAARVFAGLEKRDFVWVHLSDAEIVHGRRKPPRRRSADNVRSRVHLRKLLAFSSPEVDLPESERQLYWRVYGEGLKRVDRKLGWILAGLRKSPLWEKALVVVTATHGLELGEHGQILSGMNLGRESIEVPMAVKLPAGSVVEPFSGRLEQTRLFATVLEAAGQRVAPVHPPSLIRVSAEPILSELYGGNGTNVFSLLSGDVQLLWTARFATAEPDYHLARWVLAGGALREMTPGAARRLTARLEEAFDETPPLGGEPGSVPELRLERWSDHGVEALSDPVLARRLAGQLRDRFLRFADRERTPAEERSARRKAAPSHPEG